MCSSDLPSELEARFSGWLGSEWQVVLLEYGEVVIGYGIYRLQPDSYFPERTVVYVRQYFIRREYRGQGLGRAGFELMVEELFPSPCRILLEALASNPSGLAFWQHLGFHPYSIALVRE